MRRDEPQLATRRRAHWAAAGVLSVSAVVIIIAVAMVVVPLITGNW